MLDVVVRDKKGKRVPDLEAGDLRILDNGVECKISSFSLVQGNGGLISAENPIASATPTTRKLDPLRQVRLVTLIFNRLDLDSRNISRSAALDLLKNQFPQNVYMAFSYLAIRFKPFNLSRMTCIAPQSRRPRDQWRLYRIQIRFGDASKRR